ncbi:MAG: HAMP domain-containing sensor histidine kinase [Deltaproteobacteria bacterium]
MSIAWLINGVLVAALIALVWRRRRSTLAPTTPHDLMSSCASILDALSTAYVLLDGEQIVFANRGFGRLFELDPREVAGCALVDVLGARQVDPARLGGLTEGALFATLPRAGTVELTKSAAAPLMIEGRRFEIVRFEPAAQPDTSAFEQRDRLASLGIMTAMVMHQQKSVLQALNNNIAAAIEELNTIDFVHNDELSALAEVYASLTDMDDESQRMATLVTDFAEFVSPQSSTPGPVDLSSSAERALRMLQGQAAPRTRLESDLSEVALVVAEELRVQQILINLVTNAMQAVADGERAGEVTVRTLERDGRVHLEVEDNGPGIPAELRSRIFDPMFTTKQRGEGTGLGLFIVKRIADDLGAVLSLDSAPGRGTKFTLTFDRLVPRSTSGAVVLEPQGIDGPASRILVVDEDLTTVGTLRARMPSWQLTVARSLEEGNALLDRRAFDVVLIDASRGTDGVERTVNALTNGNGRRTQVVVMVRRGQDHHVRPWAEPAGCAIATKPLDAQALATRLSTHRARP